MKQLLLATAAILGLTAAAHAVPIPAGSTLNITGSATFTNTQVNFSTPAAVTPGTGAYTALGTCATCAVINTPLTYSPFTAGLLFTVTNLGNTATVSLVSQIVPPTVGANVLNIQDNASLTLTGFDTTPGQLFLTVNQATGAISGSFSATAQATPAPEPASLALLGVGLLGLGFVVRRKHS